VLFGSTGINVLVYVTGVTGLADSTDDADVVVDVFELVDVAGDTKPPYDIT
jgi:hypothetical protein